MEGSGFGVQVAPATRRGEVQDLFGFVLLALLFLLSVVLYHFAGGPKFGDKTSRFWSGAFRPLLRTQEKTNRIGSKLHRFWEFGMGFGA